MPALKSIPLAAAILVFGAAGAARAAELPAEPVCRRCRPASCYAPVTACQPVTAYRVDPCCERVGPVRRFLRRVFHPCCPPTPPVRVVVPTAPVCPCPPGPPAAWAPPAAPVVLDRPVPAPFPGPGSAPVPPPPPGPVDVPGTGSSLRRDGVLTPPTRPTPIRLDRIASRTGGAGATHQVTLVQMGKPALRRQAETDGAGQISVDLTPGTWVVYTQDANGKPIETGRLIIRASGVVRVRLIES